MDQGVGHEVKRLREKRGWSQAKLAVEAKMSVSGVSMIENGQRNLTTTTLAKLANALEVEVADLFPKEQSRLPFEDGERRGGVGEGSDREIGGAGAQKIGAAMARKIEQQYITNRRNKEDKYSIAGSDEDLHEAEKAYHKWYLETFDWALTLVSVCPDANVPELAQVFNKARQEIGLPEDAVNPRDVPDMTELLQEWPNHQHTNA